MRRVDVLAVAAATHVAGGVFALAAAAIAVAAMMIDACAIDNSDSGCPRVELSRDQVDLSVAAPVTVGVTGCGMLVQVVCTDNVSASYAGEDLGAAVELVLEANGPGSGGCAIEAQSGVETAIAVVATTL